MEGKLYKGGKTWYRSGAGGRKTNIPKMDVLAAVAEEETKHTEQRSISNLS